MNRLAAGLLILAGVATAAPVRAAPQSTPQVPAAAATAQLATVIQQSVAAARTVQQHEREVASLAGDLVGAGSDLAAQQQTLDRVRTRATIVLAALERLAHAPPQAALLAAQQPIDRARSGMVLAAIVPALAAEAHGLVEKRQQLIARREELLAKRDKLAADEQALAKARDGLAKLMASRDGLRQQILHAAAASDPRAVPLGAAAATLSDLIQRADAEQDRYDRELHPRAARTKGAAPADPTRPTGLRVMTVESTLARPVAGPIVRRFGDTEENGKQSQGLALDVISGGIVVAPFDGRVAYAGPFDGLGTILIIGHGGGYHSVLAGLGRVDAAIGEWLVAGEPIGTMPNAAKSDESVTVTYELRHDGNPIDPQPFLGGRAP